MLDGAGPRRHGLASRSGPATHRTLTEAGLAAHLGRLDRTLSRTVATGRADRAASPLKQDALVAGPALRARVAANRRLVARFLLWRRRAWPQDALEHFGAVCTVAHLAGLGLLPEGLFRRWPYDVSRHGGRAARRPIAARAVPPALLALMARVARARSWGPAARLALVAQVEWELGIGPLHPFYDGCGRVSRYVATLLSLWLDVPLATHASREGYFRAARAGRAHFVAYYRERTRGPAPRRRGARRP